MNIVITPTESLTDGRTGFEVRDAAGRLLACGFCTTDKLLTFPQECVKDAVERPYIEIRKTFLTGGRR